MRVGIDRNTGQLLTGWPHCVQCIGLCLTTRLASRPIERHLGCDVPDIQDANADPMTLFRFFGAIAAALADPDSGEPGFRLARISLAAAPRQGRFAFILTGTFFPLGHRSDWSVREEKSLPWPEVVTPS